MSFDDLSVDDGVNLDDVQSIYHSIFLTAVLIRIDERLNC